jgi:hypothetical protein
VSGSGNLELKEKIHESIVGLILNINNVIKPIKKASVTQMAM